MRSLGDGIERFADRAGVGAPLGDGEPTEDCWTCASNSGKRRISPAGSVYEGTYWLVEHAYPAALLGWMVIVLKRHVAALHELSDVEFQELGRIQPALVAELSGTLRSEKEYVACFAEGEHFRHIHFHVVAVPKGIPSAMRGARSFQFLQINEDEAVKPQDVRDLCDALRRRLAVRLGSPT